MRGRQTGQPLVSVVTPVYNGEDYLVECIESVLAQTYESWDYTIVDNASTDSTPEIAQRYAARTHGFAISGSRTSSDATANHNRAFAAISPRASSARWCRRTTGCTRSASSGWSGRAASRTR